RGRRRGGRTVAAMTLDYDDAGTGPPVVLLHAGVCDRRMWSEQARGVSAVGFRVIRPDLRGYGGSPASPEPYNDGDDVIGLLDAVGVDDAFVVGASFGGTVALELASRWPERVRALVLLCSALASHEPSPAFRARDAREDELLDAGDI